METSEKNVLILLGRHIGYLLLMFIMYLLLTYVILSEKWAFSENGIIEWIQFSLLSLLFVSLAVNSIVFTKVRELLLLLMSCSILAMTRELDKILDALIPFFGWQVIFFLIVPLVLLQFRNWQKLRKQLLKFATSPAMGVFLMGVVVVLPLAQCIGDSDYMRAAMRGEYIRKYKTLFEESMELYGYLILLCGGCEVTFFARRYQKEENNS